MIVNGEENGLLSIRRTIAAEFAIELKIDRDVRLAVSWAVREERW